MRTDAFSPLLVQIGISAQNKNELRVYLAKNCSNTDKFNEKVHYLAKMCFVIEAFRQTFENVPAWGRTEDQE